MEFKIKIEDLEISIDDGNEKSIVEYDSYKDRAIEVANVMAKSLTELIKVYYPNGKPDNKPHVIDITPESN